jgi:dihydrofolate reductase
MTKVLSGITMSVDGYVAGPNDGPGKGLGEGGERLHYWVFGGPWTYDAEPSGRATGDDAEWLKHARSKLGAVVGGRYTYEAADHWGGENPEDVPFFIVTHRPEEEPPGKGFRFVSGVEAAVEQAREAAGDKDVHVMGGADVIRQALEAGLVDELTIIVAPRRARRRQAVVRGLLEVAGTRAPRRAPVAVRDIHRLPGEEQPRGLNHAGARAFRSNLCQALSPRRKPHVPLRRAQTMIGR